MPRLCSSKDQTIRHLEGTLPLRKISIFHCVLCNGIRMAYRWVDRTTRAKSHHEQSVGTRLHCGGSSFHGDGRSLNLFLLSPVPPTNPQVVRTGHDVSFV